MSDLIVVIDDEEDLVELLEYNLTKAGFEVVGFYNVLKVEQFLDEEDVSLMIVDRNLIHAEGAQYIKAIRKKGYNTPVIFLSAKDSKQDKLDVFDSGADDYITKPFDMDDLIARVKAVIKRTKKDAKIYKFKDISLNLDTKELIVADKIVKITKLELKLMLEFMKNIGILLSRDHLWDSVWDDSELNEKTLNIAIKRLREKLGDSDHIVSVRSQGYML